MQVNIELRNLRGEARADVLDTLRRADGEVEIRVRARDVEVDTFGRDTILRCGAARIDVAERDRDAGEGGERGRPREREGRGGHFFELNLGGLGGGSSPRGRSSERMMDRMMGGPLILPPPTAPAWASDIGDTTQRIGAAEAQRRRSEREEIEEADAQGPTLRFGHRPHGWGH